MDGRILNEIRYAIRQLNLLNMRRELAPALRDYVTRARDALQTAECQFVDIEDDETGAALDVEKKGS